MGVCGSNDIKEHTSNPVHSKKASTSSYSRNGENFLKGSSKNNDNEKGGRGKSAKGEKQHKEDVTADLKSNKSRATSTSSHSANPNRNEPRKFEDVKNALRKKEEGYLHYLENGSEKTRYLIDAEWMNMWVAFIKKDGSRPWNDINKRMHTIYEDGRVGFKSSRKSYLISKDLWDKLKEIYGSKFTFEVQEGKTCQVYLHNKKQDVDEIIDLTNQDDSNKSEVDYLPTERDQVYPIKANKDTENSGACNPAAARLYTVQYADYPSGNTIFDKVIKSNLDETSSVIDLTKKGIGIIMKAQEVKAYKLEDNIDVATDEFVSQPTCEIGKDCVAPPIGFKNYGVTCYANACLQCLLCIPEMNTYFLDEHFTEIKHATRNSSMQICKILAKLYKEVFGESCPEWIAPKEIVDNLCPSGQQDAHEFLWRKIYQHIQDETNPISKRIKQGNMSFKVAWELYKKNNKSIFDLLFGGLYESKVCCQRCGNISLTYDPFLDISLPVTKKTIQDCVQLHFKEEVLSKEESYKCEKCKKVVQAVKSLKVAKPPRYLILHLKRLINGSKKINTFIKYPVVLDVTEYCAEDAGEVQYTLLAVCVHSGGAQSGHYYTLGRRATNWYEFDDKSATHTKEAEVLKHEAYMLFYARLQ